MKIPKKIEILRQKKVLLITKTENNEFAFLCGKIKYNIFDEKELTNKISFVEENQIKIWEIIDALTQSDVLHPIYHDTQISPVGRSGKYKIHIRWEGFGEEIHEYFTEKLPIDQKKLIEDLRILGNRVLETSNILEKEKDVNKAYIRAFEVLFPLFLETIFPNASAKGILLRKPFRRLTISNFRGTEYFSIRLTPSEARKIARFLSI